MKKNINKIIKDLIKLNDLRGNRALLDEECLELDRLSKEYDNYYLLEREKKDTEWLAFMDKRRRA